MQSRHKEKQNEEKHRSSEPRNVPILDSPSAEDIEAFWLSMMKTDEKSSIPSPTPIKQQGGNKFDPCVSPTPDKKKAVRPPRDRYYFPPSDHFNPEIGYAAPTLAPAPAPKPSTPTPLSGEWWIHHGDVLGQLAERSLHLSNAVDHASSTFEELSLLAELSQLNADGIKSYSEIISALQGQESEAHVKVRKESEERLEMVLELERSRQRRVSELQMKMHQEVNNTKLETVDYCGGSEGQDELKKIILKMIADS